MPQTQPFPENQAGRILATAAGAVFLVALDSALLTGALPAISQSLPAFSSRQLGWVISGYSIILGALLVPAGYVVDLAGRKTMLMAGLVIFCVGALCCAVSTSPSQLILARGLQAVGGALALPASLALVLNSVPADQRAASVGKWSAAAGLATALGPPLAAAFLHFASWRTMFWLHVPATFAVLASSSKFLKQSKGSKGSLRLSFAIALCAIGIGYLMATAPDALATGQHRFLQPMLMIAAGGCLAFRDQHFRSDFGRWERSCIFAGTLCFGAVFGSMLVGLDFLLVYRFGFVTSLAALMLSPIPLLSIPAATLSGKLERGPRFSKPLVLGVSVLLGAAICFYWLCGGAEFRPAAWAGFTVLSAAGIGLCFPALTLQATKGISPQRFALGCALSQACRHTGTALGVALFTSRLGNQTAGAFLGAAFLVCTFAVAMLAFLLLSAVPSLHDRAKLRWSRQDLKANSVDAAVRSGLPRPVLKTEDKL